MTGHVLDSARVEAQRKAKQTAGRDRSPDRGRVARQAVASWDRAQRARIRASLLQLRHFGDGQGERDVLDLIDRAESSA